MINIPKGTKDVLPQESYKWQYIENIARQTADLFNLKEIRTPVFGHTELFSRGVGGITDTEEKVAIKKLTGYILKYKGDR